MSNRRATLINQFIKRVFVNGRSGHCKSSKLTPHPEYQSLGFGYSSTVTATKYNATPFASSDVSCQVEVALKHNLRPEMRNFNYVVCLLIVPF